MFKRFLPTLASSNPTLSHGETLFDLEASSGNSSSKRSDCSSEQINKSDIPTLRRRHSFVTPYAELVLEEEINRTNGNADLSIDPFDSSNTLKRSKSLSFNLSRRPSLSTLRKKVPKSVHFEPLEELIEESNYGSKQTVVPILYGTPETFEGKSNCVEKPSAFQPNYGEKRNIQNQLGHKKMNLLGSQENEIQRRYSLFSEERIISELELEESQASRNEILNDNFLPVNNITPKPVTNIEEYEESDDENSCLFTEYSQENVYDENDDNTNADNSEKPIQEDEEVTNNENQMMKAIMQNLVKIGNYELENIRYDIDHSSWKGILDYSEKAKDAIRIKDTEIVQLKNQLKERDNGSSEKVCFLQEECVRLQNELNSCKIASEQTSTKYDHLVSLNNELGAKEKSLRSDIMQLETDLSSSVSRLQVECGSREEILTLIKKYDCREELSDSVDVLKDYIEQLFLRNESHVKENDSILEYQLRMKNEIASLEESLKTTLDREQETLKSVTDENERLQTNLEELQSKLNDSDMITKEKMNEQTKILTEKDVQMSKLKSQVVFLKEEKEYLQAKLSEYLADVEEANKQIKEELVFRNQTEKVYNELKMRMKETENVLHKEVKIAKDQLILKQSELTELRDINSKIEKEMILILEDLKHMNDEKEKLAVENQKYVRENTEYKLNLNSLQEHIKKSNKNVDIMSKEYLMVLKSNEIISNAIKRFAMAAFQSLEPVMYEESREYFRKIYSSLVKQALFSQGKVCNIESVSQFITRCISDIVCQYLENEALLQSEVENRNNNYQRMLDKLTNIMEDNILKAYNSKENINDIGIRKLQTKNKMDMESHRRGIIYKNPNQ